jgi:L,D-transpeptidase catalytic domain
MAHQRTHRTAGVRPLSTAGARPSRTAGAVVAALLAVVLLAGCAYNTAASSSQHNATQVGLVAPVHTARAATPAAGTPARTPSPRPAPKAVNHCAHNTAARLVLVSVTWQHAWMCQGVHVVYSAAVTTGAVDLSYQDTPTGTFQIQGKYTDRTLTLASGAQYQVKYWIPFQGPLFGFHDAPWQNFPFGSRQYRTEGSHGCVHLSLKTIEFLYGWADIGTPVTITA